MPTSFTAVPRLLTPLVLQLFVYDVQEMKEFLIQVVKDLLWSDPSPRDGTCCCTG